VPGAALSRAGRSILWWIATALEGSMVPEQAELRRYFGHQGGPAESSVFGARLRVPAEVAGLINGRAGKVNEREEKYWVSESIGFSVGVCVIPAAVAVAQAVGPVSGRDLLAAVAVATGFEARLLRPVGLGFIPGRKAANTSFALGNYGAAVVAGKLLGLSQERFLDALGLAHGQSCGSYQGQYDGRGVPVQCGFAVRNEIIAARLASAGVSASRPIHAALSPSRRSAQPATSADGAELSSGPVVIARGHPGRPLPTAEIEDLFRAPAERALVPAAQARQALRMLVNLESVADVGDIVTLLGSDGPR
jgi:2-methylcitrate dehydratase PrpD